MPHQPQIIPFAADEFLFDLFLNITDFDLIVTYVDMKGMVCISLMNFNRLVGNAFDFFEIDLSHFYAPYNRYLELKLSVIY